MKKAQIWISVVLYMALGVIVLTLILTAGVPMINKMRDKNTVVQTKNLFISLDENIRTVATEGPGSKRFLSPFEIRSGEFYIDEDNDKIYWTLTTTAKLLEPGMDLKEGPITQRLDNTNIVNQYKIKLSLDYKDFADIELQSDFQNPFTGVYSLSIRNEGYSNNKPKIVLEMKS